MDGDRRIRKVIKSQPTLEGAGVHLHRAFAFREVPAFDPFLLLDDFRSSDPREYLRGFPWHPHRGIETITYVLRGSVEHGDSLGNRGVIRPGDVQWMTAGSGIIHQEMPKGDTAGIMGGFQLWANLPASHKMMAPRYHGVTQDEIPVVSAEKGVKIRVICGQVQGQEGPVRGIVTNPQYLDISVPERTELVHPTRLGDTVFAYVIEGKARFGGEKDPFDYEVEGLNYFDLERTPFVTDQSVVLFKDGERLAISTEEDPCRFLLVSGEPIGEPIAWYGPIVMNTQAELEQAFAEYGRGTFIKRKNR
jgi:redox-sensitive bicupin YhaK (pirin superfamily)